MKTLNKKSQSIFVGVQIAMMLFVFAIATIGAYKEVIVEARDVNHLDCANTSITTGTAGACIVADWSLPYYFGMMLAIAASFLIGKKLVEQ